jgi:hypothetical protein
MSGNVRIHTWPIKALEEALLGFVDSIMPGEKLPMGFRQCFRDQGCGQKEHHAARLKLSFNSAPHQAILDEAIIGKKFDKCLTLGILG